MQYYLWKGDLAGQLLMWRALQAADRGVRVRFLIDDIYHSGRDDVYALLDTHPNFELRVFNPMANRGLARNLNFLANKKYLNHRMHNKLLIADSQMTILGGRNIGDHYFGLHPKYNFHDLDVIVLGAGEIPVDHRAPDLVFQVDFPERESPAVVHDVVAGDAAGAVIPDPRRVEVADPPPVRDRQAHASARRRGIDRPLERGG